MKVSDSKGLANHAVPESCAVHREVRREALTGVRVGQTLSRERVVFQDADVVGSTKGNTSRCDTASTWTALRGRRPRARTETLCTGAGRSHACPWEMALGDAP